MRKTWSALRCSIGRMLSWRTIVFTVLSAALYVTLLPYVHQEGASIEEVLLTLVGGFEYEEIIAFKLDELFVWTLLLMSYLRCVSIAMQEEYDGRCKDTLYRFSSYQSWYMNQAIAASVACAGITLLIVIGAVTGALLWGRGQFGAIMATMEGFYAPAWQHCLIALGLLLCNALMLTQWQMLVHLVTGHVVTAAAAFLLPIVASLYACSNAYLHPISVQYNPINWGMYMRSNYMSDPGFPILRAVIGQLGIAAVCAWMGGLLARKVNLAGRHP